MSKQAPIQDPTDTLRKVSQPQRDLVAWLQKQFAAGVLKPGGKVVLPRK